MTIKLFCCKVPEYVLLVKTNKNDKMAVVKALVIKPVTVLKHCQQFALNIQCILNIAEVSNLCLFTLSYFAVLVYANSHYFDRVTTYNVRSLKQFVPVFPRYLVPLILHMLQ